MSSPANRPRLSQSRKFGGRWKLGPLALACIFLVVGPAPREVWAEKLISLRNGVTLRGNYIERATLDQNSFSAASAGTGLQIRPIWMVDDGLRRTYIHRRGMVSAEPVEVPELGQRIEIFQPVPDSAADVSAIGTVLGVTPFNDYGRRRMRLRGPDGSPMVIHQGLTELTARYAKVESLVADKTIRLDMRLATSTLDTPTLLRILRRRLDQDDLDDRLEIVRFLIETERYTDAHQELQRVLRDFPEQEQLRPQLSALVEQQAIQLLQQAELRRTSGQPQLAEAILRRFPVGRVGQVTRLRVQDLLQEIDDVAAQSRNAIAKLKQLAKEGNPAQDPRLQAVMAEIETHLSEATLPRLSDFIRFADSDAMSPENRVALAVAGWTMGNGSGEQNLKIALSTVEVRDLVRAYLAEPDTQRRSQLLEQLNGLEGARAEYIARMLPLMRPPLDPFLPEQPTVLAEQTPAGQTVKADPLIAGMFRVGPDHETYQGLFENGRQVEANIPTAYAVQLPPEYDPRRAYPCVIALHANGVAAESQLNWWAGPATKQFLSADRSGEAKAATGDSQGRTAEPATALPAEKSASPTKMRLGNAMRHGFIVVTPRWSRPDQRNYEYTAREHDAVLRAMRDAMRRFSIDADRVFLAGHGPGATAAWDIAVSHPDLWAGFVSIGPDPEKTLQHYDDNGHYVAAYIVTGNKDQQPLKRYGAILDDYMSYQHDAMVVMYRGRGREFFYEEAERIFEWMKTPAHRRRPCPQKIETVSMRAGDNFFWWLEWDEMLPDVAIDPLLWESAPRLKAAEVRGFIGANNDVVISQAPARAFTVWLGPHQPLQFDQPITVRYRTRRVDFRFEGGIRTMLEDVLSRADRLRPYWGRVSIP